MKEFKLDAIFQCIFMVFVFFSNCAEVQSQETSLSVPTPPVQSIHSSALAVPHGIMGLELGMTPEQVTKMFTIKEDQDPLASLLSKYGKLESSEAVLRRNKVIKKSFFRVNSGTAKLPDHVTSIDFYSLHNILYKIGLHYAGQSAKNIGWQGITYPYISNIGKPSKDTGSSMIWDDGRTRLDIESSGSTINVFFTDEPLELELLKAEREQM